MKIEILSDEKIEKAKTEAERLSWTHKAHPRFEKEKYLLLVARRDTIEQMVEWLIVNYSCEQKLVIIPEDELKKLGGEEVSDKEGRYG